YWPIRLAAITDRHLLTNVQRESQFRCPNFPRASPEFFSDGAAHRFRENRCVRSLRNPHPLWFSFDVRPANP
ncbi:MAG TPA: hypothetical protein VH022_11040, partial [Candidatus Acidoferrum sp.]|nr:hypothetical protein [Candidatus Acidoferrum sp.]